MASKRKQKREPEFSRDELLAMDQLVALLPPEERFVIGDEVHDRQAIRERLRCLIEIAPELASGGR